MTMAWIFDECWKEDVEAMVHQDYNHPCVIMYSIGNELAEPITERGRKIADEMIALVHKLDDTRPVTCGVNLMVMSRVCKRKWNLQRWRAKYGSLRRMPWKMTAR